jgi:hypothetical protein
MVVDWRAKRRVSEDKFCVSREHCSRASLHNNQYPDFALVALCLEGAVAPQTRKLSGS